MTDMRKARSELVKDAVIYQVNLRVFTEEGNLAAAARHLPEVAATGANVLYLCPLMETDSDEDVRNWSDRQRESLCGNPRNPYRIKDYYHVDAEYGSDEDFRSFVEAAHRLGLKVMLDLVYLHAGPAFGKAHPDFVMKDESGNVKLNQWHFCVLDFNVPELREYLWQNMVYWVREFGMDGFRCDVGGGIPLDFWCEGRRRCEKVKQPLLMLNEADIASRPADQDEAFDINYANHWITLLDGISRKRMNAVGLEYYWNRTETARRGAVVLRALENHDYANDNYYGRIETLSSAKCDASYVLSFTVTGVPFLYNGCEHCDTSRHSIFGKPGQFFIDRSKDPAPRTALLHKLAELHRSEPAIRDGSMQWLPNSAPAVLCTYRRVAPSGEAVFCAVNFGNEPVVATCAEAEAFAGGQVLLERDSSIQASSLTLGANGFLVIKGN
ncbi:MAG: hypothetical protein IJJ26_00370 [Victivallales bacterium]|nr:hypothetical protein [Victivallales bacterium]